MAPSQQLKQQLTSHSVSKSHSQELGTNPSQKELGSATKRLHITPFSPALFSTIVPPSLQPATTNVSYHALQTFPDTGYGYLNLPSADAEKLKKKLNGAILKGHKMRVEVARPEKWPVAIDKEDSMAESKPKKKRTNDGAESSQKKKRKVGDRTEDGFELPDRRKVQRGWTQPAVLGAHSHRRGTRAKEDKKDGKTEKQRSKYTTKEECLFKTKLPPNVAAAVETRDKKVKDKKGRKTGKEIVVHEFETTTRHASFLRDSDVQKGKDVRDFVEGKGWVDEDGNIIEEVRVSRKGARLALQRAEDVAVRGRPGIGEHAHTANPDVDKDSRLNLGKVVDIGISQEESRSMESSGRESEEQVDVSGISSGFESSEINSADGSGEVKLCSSADAAKDLIRAGHAGNEKENDWTSSSGTTSSDEEDGVDAVEASDLDQPTLRNATAAQQKPKQKGSPSAEEDKDYTSSSGGPSDGDTLDSGSASEFEEDPSNANTKHPKAKKTSTLKPRSTHEIPSTLVSATSPTTSARNLTIQIPTQPATGQVHPLEALFKKPKPTADTALAPAQAEKHNFGFLAGSEDIDDEGDHRDSRLDIPLTPFRQIDFHERGLRSAAPEPDTAVAGRRFRFWEENGDEDEDNDRGAETHLQGAESPTKERGKGEMGKVTGTGTGVKQMGEVVPETDFKTWFYEHRGENNRAWKTRRREVAKEKRQKGNRDRRGRAGRVENG